MLNRYNKTAILKRIGLFWQVGRKKMQKLFTGFMCRKTAIINLNCNFQMESQNPLFLNWRQITAKLNSGPKKVFIYPPHCFWKRENRKYI